MNPQFLGDSYDLVKRFFILELQSLGYIVEIDPMFTGSWKSGEEDAFCRLLGLHSTIQPEATKKLQRSLFLDPDTGLNERGGMRHASLEQVAREVQKHELVFAFDQSFSRQTSPLDEMNNKMKLLAEHDVNSFYYDSHARFLFASKRKLPLRELMNHLVKLGVPRSRIITNND
jgi:hypothetical protein